MNHQNSSADHAYFGQDVATEDERVLATKLFDQRAGFNNLGGVNANRWLIQDQNVWLMQDGLRNSNPLSKSL